MAATLEESDVLTTTIADTLHTGGFTPAEIAAAYSTTIYRVRQILSSPPPRLCDGCLDEIEYDTKLIGLRNAQLAKVFRCDLMEVQRLKYHKQRKQPTRDELVHDYCVRDMPIAKLARKYDRRPSTIEKLLRQHDLIDSSERRVTQKEMILQMLEQGQRPQDIADMLDCPVQTVRTYSSANGFTTQVHNRLDTDTWDMLLTELTAGASITALAHKYGVSRAAIYKKRKAQ